MSYGQFPPPPGGKERQDHLRWLKAWRREQVKEASAKYEKLPANIRAALAKVAGVENRPLLEAGAGDRRLLHNASMTLAKDLFNARDILASVDWTRSP